MENTLLEEIKSALGVTGTYQDKTLNVYINDVKDYLKNAGVKDAVINSERAHGTIARGVADIWNLGSGTGALSPYFYERVIQLATIKDGDSNV